MKREMHPEALITQYQELHLQFQELIHSDEKFSEVKAIYVAMRNIYAQLAQEEKDRLTQSSQSLH